MFLVKNKDDAGLFYSTHKGATGLTIVDPGKDFKSCGVTVGLAVKNVTDDSTGLVTAVSETSVTCTLSGGSLNTFTAGDYYRIYCTDTIDDLISSHYTDKRFGTKVTNRNELDRHGIMAGDEDLDEEHQDIFGPGQPEPMNRGGM